MANSKIGLSVELRVGSGKYIKHKVIKNKNKCK